MDDKCRKALSEEDRERLVREAIQGGLKEVAFFLQYADLGPREAAAVSHASKKARSPFKYPLD